MTLENHKVLLWLNDPLCSMNFPEIKMKNISIYPAFQANVYARERYISNFLFTYLVSMLDRIAFRLVWEDHSA